MSAYLPGYAAAMAKVEAQSLEDNLRLIDDLFGRDMLRYGDGSDAVKREALRQLEIEFRDRDYILPTGCRFWDNTPGEP